MKILIVDCDGMCLDIAFRAQAAGHEVRCYIRNNKDGSRNDTGKGMITRVPDWEASMGWADLIFCTDNILYIHRLDDYRKKGYPIIGPSQEATDWEQDRQIGADVHERMDVPTIPMKKFSNYDDAIAYVIKNPQRYVSKPVGDGDKALSYVSKSPADLVFMLQKWKKTGAYKGEFVLQEFRGGIEMAVGGWFGSNGFTSNFCENWEFKKFMNNDLGQATGEQGTILRYTETSKLAEAVLRPCEGMLHGLGYTGYVDVNCIIDKNGNPWPLEWTMRPGWPLFQIQQSLHKGDPIEWMADLLDGKDTLRVSKDVACGVVISIPDYPYYKLSKKDCSGYPLFDITDEDLLTDIHPSWVMCGKAPSMDGDKVKLDTEMYITAGAYVATVTGTGETVEEAKDKCYNTIKKKINIPNSVQYRSDIGCRLEEQLPELRKNGFCKDLRY